MTEPAVAASVEVRMPQMGETVTEGTITAWLKAPGDRIAVDESLLEISTDKVDSEIPAPVAGVLAEIVVPEGDTVPIGELLARITTDGATPTPDTDGATPAHDPPATTPGGMPPAPRDAPAPRQLLRLKPPRHRPHARCFACTPR